MYFSLFGLYSFIENLFFSLSQLKYLWIVDAFNFVTSDSFFAALPVGAKSAISSSLALNSSFISFTMVFIMVVFPVPGPPVIIVKLYLLLLFYLIHLILLYCILIFHY